MAAPMDIRDVSYIAIVDSRNDVLYSMNPGDINVKALLSTVTPDYDPISMYEEKPLMVSKNGELTILFLGTQDANEIFLKEALDGLIESLEKILKHWKTGRVAEKYDQIILLMNEFLFRGVILADNSADLNKRMIKRNFETLNGIKMTKGFASFLNKATKSFTRRS